MRNLILAILLIGSANASGQDTTEVMAIKSMMEKTYLHVLCENGDPEVLRQSFHPSFHMYVSHDGQTELRTFEDWIARLKKNRNPGKEKGTWQFKYVDVTGATASLKVELYEKGKLKYTDYFTLYKLEDGWKVFAKAFTYHGGSH
ncbi:MAG: nuclear transport factor 2 family protein [Cyclobacteriaceae bacterium]